jgi:hypothetical protein
MKDKRIIGLAVLLLVAMVAANGLWAQDQMALLDYAPSIKFESPVSKSTQGMFGSDTDSAISTTGYLGVDFDSWLAWTSFDGTPTLGFATKTGGIYIGALYQGTLFRNTAGPNYSEIQAPNPYNLPAESLTFGGKKYNSYTLLPNYAYTVNAITGAVTFSTPRPNNNIAIMVGIADMGIGLNFSTSLLSFSAKEFMGGVDAYKEYKAESGWIIPGIRWGMATDLLPQGIRPSVAVDFGFWRDNKTYTQYEDTFAIKDFPERFTSDNFFAMQIDLGLGGYTLLEKDAVSVYADFGYSVGIVSAKNDVEFVYVNDVIDYMDPTKHLYSSYTINGFGTTELSGTASHTIAPAVGASIDFGPVSFGAHLSLPIEISTSTVTEYSLYQEDVTVNSVTLRKESVTSTTETSFSPVLYLGMQFSIRDGKITLNAGGGIGLSTITGTKTKTEAYDPANNYESGEVLDTSLASTTSYAGTWTSISIGATFHFSDNVWLEATAVVGGNGFSIFGTGADSISAFGGTNGSILFGLRF